MSETAEMEMHIITPPVADETDLLDNALVTLTEAICKATGEETGFGLGGRFGYGEDFENEVFVMRRFYWGDCDCGWDELESDWCDNHFHAESCYQQELERAKIAAGWTKGKYGWLDRPKDAPYEWARAKEDEIYRSLCSKHKLPYPTGCAVHCTCDHNTKWLAFCAEHGHHKDTCSLELPNFHHKPTGLKVRWYKWIGRSMEVDGIEGVDINAIFNDCLASLPATPKKEGEDEREWSSSSSRLFGMFG